MSYQPKTDVDSDGGGRGRVASVSMLVVVNNERCVAIGHRLREVGVPVPIEPHGLTASEAPFDLPTLNLILVAICHQTQRLMGSVADAKLRGWDYLQARLQLWASTKRERLLPSELARLSTDELTTALNCGNQLTSTDIDRRAALIRDCGDTLQTMNVEGLGELYDQCGRKANTLLEFLCRFAAYRDPVRKKALFLLGLNSVTCDWKLSGQDVLDPPVDYHEVRGHLRLGTVRIIDSQLRSDIYGGATVSEYADVEIRKAVTRAIQLIAASSGFSPIRLHYAFWNLFRSICVRGAPICKGASEERIPETYRHLVPQGNCCLLTLCDSCNVPQAINEHVFVTEWY